MKKFIAVAGNIGVGKSTLVRLLCERLGCQPFYEPAVENPYLEDFYRDMPAWSFQSQVFFLTHRLHVHLDIMRQPGTVIMDRSLYEDAGIFARNLHLQGHMSARDYATYQALYEGVAGFISPPDLLIYLRASVPTLLERIALRSRQYEQSIAPQYLAQLNGLYEEWIAGFNLSPVLAVPADDLDYVAHPRHLDLIVERVLDKLTGKEEVSFPAAF